MDEKTVTLLTDPADLAIGKTIFTTNCSFVTELMLEDKLVLTTDDGFWGRKNILSTINNGVVMGKE
jgi:cytochrome c oxidase cbb3-type subunit 3